MQRHRVQVLVIHRHLVPAIQVRAIPVTVKQVRKKFIKNKKQTKTCPFLSTQLKVIFISPRMNESDREKKTHFNIDTK